MKNLKVRGKHMKRRRIKLTDRFYALMLILLGIGSLLIFKAMNEYDVTGPVFVILLGLLAYIGTYGED